VVATKWAAAHAAELTSFIHALHESIAALLADPKSPIRWSRSQSRERPAEIYPAQGWASCPRQSATLWQAVIKSGMDGGDFKAGVPPSRRRHGSTAM
jgi:hypothetical protein